MGAKLLSITLGSLVVIGFIDLFTFWYANFLKRWMPNIKIRILLGHLVWAILALSFWRTLYHQHFPETFTLTYFFFVLFIYSVRGLIDSLIKGRHQKSIES